MLGFFFVTSNIWFQKEKTTERSGVAVASFPFVWEPDDVAREEETHPTSSGAWISMFFPCKTSLGTSDQRSKACGRLKLVLEKGKVTEIQRTSRKKKEMCEGKKTHELAAATGRAQRLIRFPFLLRISFPCVLWFLLVINLHNTIAGATVKALSCCDLVINE